MYDALHEMLTKETLRNELRIKGYERLKEFSLEKMVAQTCDVYRKM